jgi:hypothetical protein
VEWDYEVVGFACALGTFRQEEAGLGLGGGKALVQAFDQAADFSGYISAGKEVAGPGFESAAARVGDAFEINDALQASVHYFITRFQKCF